MGMINLRASYSHTSSNVTALDIFGSTYPVDHPCNLVYIHVNISMQWMWECDLRLETLNNAIWLGHRLD